MKLCVLMLNSECMRSRAVSVALSTSKSVIWPTEVCQANENKFLDMKMMRRIEKISRISHVCMLMK